MICLDSLIEGMPGITPQYGSCIAQAAIVCLESQNHCSGVTLYIDGEIQQTAELCWLNQPPNADKCWNDEQYATEHGAYAIAI